MSVFKKPPLPPPQTAQARHRKTEEVRAARKRPATPSPSNIKSSSKAPKRRDAPLINDCVVPEHLRNTVQQDYFDKARQKHPVMHGQIDDEVGDEKLSAIHQHSAGQDTRLEVLKHTRRTLVRGSAEEQPTFTTMTLYGGGDGGVPVSASLSAWASEKAEKRRKKHVKKIESGTVCRHGVARGILRALKLRLKKEPAAPTNLHTRVIRPANPGRELFEAYDDAVRAWHESMCERLPGYKDSRNKQQWFNLRNSKWTP